MAARSVKTTNKHAEGAMEDSRRAVEALMAVDQSLQAAASVCRALVQDGRAMKNKKFSASARRILRLVEGMKTGPNVKLWEDLYPLEEMARAEFKTES